MKNLVHFNVFKSECEFVKKLSQFWPAGSKYSNDFPQDVSQQHLMMQSQWSTLTRRSASQPDLPMVEMNPYAMTPFVWVKNSFFIQNSFQS